VDKNCGTCEHWAHDKKRNCSNPETPAYYAECKHPMTLSDQLPHCIAIEETGESNGTQCPCYAALRREG
jgi:hypothetical protein